MLSFEKYFFGGSCFMNLKGTKTEQNLKSAFAGESQASMKYSYYASRAKKEGYEKIAEIFSEAAHNEHEHAKIWFKLLNNGIPSTLENLKDSASGENFEWTSMYADFAKEARDEGFDDIAELFEGVAKIEKSHESRYNSVIGCLNSDKVFKSDGECAWICRNCGHIHFGKAAPDVCPICSHPKAFFERKN